MDISSIRTRILATLEKCSSLSDSDELLSGVRQSTLTLMGALYGKNSSQETVWRSTLDEVNRNYHHTDVAKPALEVTRGVLKTMLEEVDSGFVGSLSASITAEILSDLVKLARSVLDESGTDGKDVAAVLTAAAFEDTIRRIAENEGIAHFEKLADTLEELKKKGVLQGSQVSIAQSYLTFRNRSLHARWSEVDMSSVQSVLAFTEQLLLKHFG